LAGVFKHRYSFTQEVIPVTDGNATGSQGSVSYSIGHVFYSIHAADVGSVAEGVQQPYEISVVTGIQEAAGINLIVSAFPNPVTDYLILRVDLVGQPGLFSGPCSPKGCGGFLLLNYLLSCIIL